MLQDIINSLTKSQVSTQAKYHLSKRGIKIDLLPRGQNPLSYSTL